MPELPEVETVCRGLARALKGARIMAADVRRKDLRVPFPKNLAERLKSRRVEDVTRRAKYILITLDKGEVLLLHLGMSGRMVISPQVLKPAKHDHLILKFDNGSYVHFNDPRRFGLCDLILLKDLAQHKLIQHLGIEPLGSDFTPTFLAATYKGKKTSIKAALLDQRHVVGVGNIYACEALFLAGISPKRRAGSLKKEQTTKLVPAIQKVLKAAIKAGGSSLRDYVQSDGELGYFQHQFSVYDRAGKACVVCKSLIKRIPQGGRSSFYCAVCQT